MDTTSSSTSSREEIVQEITRIHKALPSRPEIEEVEAAMTLVANTEREEASKLEAITTSFQNKSHNIPEELLTVLQEMQRNMVFFQYKEQKREALKLLELENLHSVFDDLIQKASDIVNSNSNKTKWAPSKNTVSSSGLLKKEQVKPSEKMVTRDDSYVSKAKSTFSLDGYANRLNISSKPTSTSGEDDHDDGGGDKLSLIKLASLIEVSAKKGSRELNLQNKLMDRVEWLPDSIGKLSNLVSLDLSENRIMALPSTIGGISSLTRLDLHSNRITELPDSIGDLINLTYLNVEGNQLSFLLPSIGELVRLEELQLGSNQLALLPDTIGSLVRLKILNFETNDIEEIPHSIGRCCSLKELYADYNRLKALPEAVGKIQSLEVLSIRYNNIKQLPTTMSSLTNLKELNVSFNELEFLPESLCFATSLVKMNIGNNFADLQSLPRSIGNLELLEELDISNNQIHVLPESFRMLTRLRILKVEENPLEVPPRDIAEKGAQAVVQYMAELVEKGDVKSQPLKQKKSWAQKLFFSKSNKRKREGVNYVKT